MRLRNFTLPGLCLVASLLPGIVQADVVASNKAGINITPSNIYIGQSFTTTPNVAENNIVFNFYSDGRATTPAAFGTGFLLTQVYTGTPTSLSTSTGGYLGQATASGGVYTFNANLTLQPNTQYFFYENALIPAGSISGGNVYAGGNDYLASSATGNFATDIASANFQVTGTPIAVTPEPGSVALLASMGIMGAGFLSRRRRQQAKNTA